MADIAKKAAAKPAASKTTAPRKTRAPAKPTDPAPEPAPAARSARKAPTGDGTAVIRFEKSDHRGRVRGAVNGQKFEFPVDKDVTVTAAQLGALRDSNRTFTTVTPLAGEGADEGSSAPSTLHGTAFRADAGPAEENPAISEDGKDQTHDLRQIPDAALTSGADQQTSQEQAEGANGAGDSAAG